MTVTTLTSRELNQDTSGAKKKRRGGDLSSSPIAAGRRMFC
jgi:hypothetical protein